MLWNSIIGFLCGLYELMLGVIVVFILDFLNLQEWFGLKCIKGLTTLAVWDEPTKFPGEAFSVLHTVIIIMYSTLQYIVFYVIPFKFNRLKKTPKEVLLLFNSHRLRQTSKRRKKSGKRKVKMSRITKGKAKNSS